MALDISVWGFMLHNSKISEAKTWTEIKEYFKTERDFALEYDLMLVDEIQDA